MTNKNIFILILLTIITFGIFWIVYYSRRNKLAQKERLSQTIKIPFSIKKLVNAIGQKNIIKSEYTHIKVKIFVHSIKEIKMDEIKKIKTISGTFMTSKSLTIIVGNSAKSISTQLKTIIT